MEMECFMPLAEVIYIGISVAAFEALKRQWSIFVFISMPERILGVFPHTLS